MSNKIHTKQMGDKMRRTKGGTAKGQKQGYGKTRRGDRWPLLVRKPTLFRESIAHSPVDLRPSCPKAGLRQVLSDGLPMSRLAAGHVDLRQYEGANIIKRPEDACTSRRV